MPGATQFTIGAEAWCTDGECGTVSRVVIDPVARTVTHLVVEPPHRQGLGRLVPLDLVEVLTGEVRLRCSLETFKRLEAAEETQFPSESSQAGLDRGQRLSWPSYGLGGWGGTGPLDLGAGTAALPVTWESVPQGEVAVRRGEQVRALDGAIGRVQGLVISPQDNQVTHVLLQEGHIWGRKAVAVPIAAVVSVDDGVQLNLTKQQVHDLPPADMGREANRDV
jgi:sporulation protein YlmC with PRC-barrel domain